MWILYWMHGKKYYFRFIVVLLFVVLLFVVLLYGSSLFLPPLVLLFELGLVELGLVELGLVELGFCRFWIRTLSIGCAKCVVGGSSPYSIALP